MQTDEPILVALNLSDRQPRVKAADMIGDHSERIIDTAIPLDVKIKQCGHKTIMTWGCDTPRSLPFQRLRGIERA